MHANRCLTPPGGQVPAPSTMHRARRAYRPVHTSRNPSWPLGAEVIDAEFREVSREEEPVSGRRMLAIAGGTFLATFLSLVGTAHLYQHLIG
ncbi:hypothetical protein CKO28_00505 [Rhodovibrio sodomensis]|uniref:Uncharacterized protein n=1 Tax=Rhodovibrio sodomensis TaxID=1088 RepID=A0ABS1D972_9PROT|nr:hypothetical protein [Rhodovibrio sodomensis]MBK1666521.1 hypothetical protein [Rhodovibrio sodomensis]